MFVIYIWIPRKIVRKLCINSLQREIKRKLKSRPRVLAKIKREPSKYQIRPPRKEVFSDLGRYSRPARRWIPVCRELASLSYDIDPRRPWRRRTSERRSGADWPHDSPCPTGEHHEKIERRSDPNDRILTNKQTQVIKELVSENNQLWWLYRYVTLHWSCIAVRTSMTLETCTAFLVGPWWRQQTALQQQSILQPLYR